MRAALALPLLPALLLALALSAVDAAEDINAGDRSRRQALPSEKAAPAIEKVKEVAPPAEVPRGLDIKVHEDRLSVNVKDTAFGDVMAVIANAAGFDVDLSNNVYEMKLSTKFSDTEIQRGIRRLISLINQKNYFIHYGKEGSIKHIEIYGDLASGKRTLTGSRPQGTLTPPPIVVPKITIIKRAEKPVPEEPPELPEEEEILELRYRHYTPPGTGLATTPAEEAAPDEETPPAPSDIDDDGDGYTENQGDCDDSNPGINPGAADICGDGIDQDCSGADAICPPAPSDIDDDGDGYTENQGDCNDSNPGINPGAADICGDGIDQDCSGADATCPPPPICPEAVCIPEGPIPPDSTLLNAPYVPPPTPPLHVP